MRARALVELLGGTYGVESEVGKGASFWFTVVLHPVAPESQTAVVEPEPETAVVEPEPDVVEPEPEPEPDMVEPEPEPVAVVEPARCTGLLLLADDDPLSRRVTLVALKRAGYQVDVVSDGADAVSAVRMRRYDAVLMDCEMPRMSGLDAASSIRSDEAPKRHLPIIALTAHTTPEDRDAALQAGMDDLLAKPCHPADLLAALAHWLEPITAGAARGG